MSRTETRLRQAAARRVYAFPVFGKVWDVYVEAEGPLGPRGLSLTKRQAVALAYHIAVAPAPRLVVTYL